MSAVADFLAAVEHYPYGIARVRKLATAPVGEGRAAYVVHALQAVADWEARGMDRTAFTASTARCDGEESAAGIERVAGDMLAWRRTKAVA